MSKANRGKGMLEHFNKGRGNCPICGRTGIKASYEVEANEKKIKVCKECKAGLKHNKLADKVAAL